jgi:MFS family permease
VDFLLGRDLPRQARRSLLFDSANGLGAGLFTALVINFVPVIARREGADPLLLAAITACPFAANVVGLLSVGFLPTRHRTAYIVVVQALGRGVFLLALLGDWPQALLAMFFVYYVSYAISLPAVYDALREMYPDRWRARLMGYVRIIQSGIAALGAPLGGWLMDAAGQRALLALGGGLGALGALAFSRVQLSETKGVTRSGPWAALGEFWSDPLFRGIALAWVLWGLGGFMALPLFPLVMVDRLGVSYAEVGFVSLALALGGLLSYWLSGLHVDRHGGHASLVAGFVLTWPVPLVYQLAPSAQWLTLAGLLNGLGSGAMELGWANLLLRLAPGQQRGRYAAVLNSLTGLRGVAAPFLGVALASQTSLGLAGALYVSTGVGLLGTLLLVAVSRQIPARLATAAPAAWPPRRRKRLPLEYANPLRYTRSVKNPSRTVGN